MGRLFPPRPPGLRRLEEGGRPLRQEGRGGRGQDAADAAAGAAAGRSGLAAPARRQEGLRAEDHAGRGAQGGGVAAQEGPLRGREGHEDAAAAAAAAATTAATATAGEHLERGRQRVPDLQRRRRRKAVRLQQLWWRGAAAAAAAATTTAVVAGQQHPAAAAAPTVRLPRAAIRRFTLQEFFFFNLGKSQKITQKKNS